MTSGQIIKMFGKMFVLSSVFALILQRKMRLSFRQSVCVAIFFFLTVVSPSMKPLSYVHYYTSVLTAMLIILFMIMIFLLKIPLYIRIGILITTALIYWKNFDIISFIFFRAITTKKYSNKLGEDIMEKYVKNGINIVHNFDDIPKHSTIFLANYCQDRIENPLCVTIPRKLSIIMGKAFKNVNMDNIIAKPIYIDPKGKKNFEYIRSEVKKTLEEGNNIFVYVNPPRNKIRNSIRNGMFEIAKSLKVTVTPVWFDTLQTNWLGIIKNQDFHIKVGKSFFVKDVENAKKRVKYFFQNSSNEFQKNKNNYK